MRELIRAALELGWTLLGYEVDMRLASEGWDPMGDGFRNWREERQARNLVRATDALATGARIPVWCGKGHLYKGRHPRGAWTWVPWGGPSKSSRG
ncbi:MAG TPA: hypothetical protein VNP94_01650 [Actinomycetota bacterium]|nr:hypothetical protein [Actinomycetota bacterium]